MNASACSRERAFVDKVAIAGARSNNPRNGDAPVDVIAWICAAIDVASVVANSC
ncbi:MAG TPA: hypothetical protein VGL90_08985 [Casimicrobiaceae bacterium]